MNDLNNYKIVLLGDHNVGKTSFALRIVNNSYSEKVNATIGCEFFTKIYDIPGKFSKMKLLIWDTAGQELFKTFTQNFTRNAVLSLLFLDINKINDKTALVNYINEWSKFIEDNCIFIIVPTKVDLYSGEYPQFYYEIADLYEREIHIAHPISSKTKLGIEELENQIVRILEPKNIEHVFDSINIKEKPIKSKCC